MQLDHDQPRPLGTPTATSRSLGSLLVVERLYVLSLGGQQASRRVHWRLAPLAAGVPCEDQQVVPFEAPRGHLDLPDNEVAELARRLGERMAN